MSILNQPFTTPFDTTPFNEIKNKEYSSAFKIAIKKAKKEIETISKNTSIPNFKNTIEALEFSGQELHRISSIFFNLNSAETNETIQKLAQEISPILTEFKNDITLNKELFERVKQIYDSKPVLETQEQKTLLEKHYQSFARNGANLSESKQEQLRNIDKKLSKLKLKFGENVLAETNNFKLLITDEDDLNGLPGGAKEAAKQLAESRNQDGWMFTLDYPSYIPFMTYAKNRVLRKELSLAFGSKAFKNNQFDNQNVILNIAKLRFQRARLLNYDTHADFVLEERMAKTPAQVRNFLKNLLQKAKPAAITEFKNLEKFAQKLDQINKLEKWDALYYSEKLKQNLYNLDDQELKPYFKLDNVIKGAFTIAHKLFDLNFEEIKTIDTYHKDVITYKVTDTDTNLVAIFYADFFPRPGKRNGAWMTSFKPQYIENQKEERPHVSIVCNFTKPTRSKPSLLTFNEVKTLFHEFGHALHGMLARTTYPSLSGTSVDWDFVELPSQIFENWCYEKDALKLFARHYESNEIIPMRLIDKIRKTANFQEGIQTLRQISFGLLDLSWHAQDPSKIIDVKTHELTAFADTTLYPETTETCMSTSFTHIFQGGYAAGYYSYKWAEVLDADAFEIFKSHGVFNKFIATKFKDNILSQGGTQDAMILYKQFSGKEPEPEALLKRAGLIK